MLKLLILSAVVTVVAWGGPCTASSGVWNEKSYGSGDAGGLPGNADITAGAGPLDTICGKIADSSNGVDMFEIDITGSSFTATASDRNGSTLAPALFLFNSAGDALYGDEAGTLSGLTLTPGLYFLAVTSDGNDPTHNGNDIFTLGSGLLTPTFVHTKVDGWDAGGGSNGEYKVSLTSATFAEAPEPGTIGLLGIGLLGLGVLGGNRRGLLRRA